MIKRSALQGHAGMCQESRNYIMCKPKALAPGIHLQIALNSICHSGSLDLTFTSCPWMPKLWKASWCLSGKHADLLSMGIQFLLLPCKLYEMRWQFPLAICCRSTNLQVKQNMSCLQMTFQVSLVNSCYDCSFHADLMQIPTIAINPILEAFQHYRHSETLLCSWTARACES